MKSVSKENSQGLIVELWKGDIPFPISLIAVHYWFVIVDADSKNRQRWEVWQAQQQCAYAWGHIHCDLMPAHNWLKYCQHSLVYTITEQQASILAEIIRNSPRDYPYINTYRYWPGPNSNTYVQYCLDKAKVNFTLCKKAWGKRYPTFFKRKT